LNFSLSSGNIISPFPGGTTMSFYSIFLLSCIFKDIRNASLGAVMSLNYSVITLGNVTFHSNYVFNQGNNPNKGNDISGDFSGGKCVIRYDSGSGPNPNTCSTSVQARAICDGYDDWSVDLPVCTFDIVCYENVLFFIFFYLFFIVGMFFFFFCVVIIKEYMLFSLVC
jgi:hypothetical protein